MVAKARTASAGACSPNAEQRMLCDVRNDERLAGAAHLLQGGPEIRAAGRLVEPEVADDSASDPAARSTARPSGCETPSPSCDMILWSSSSSRGLGARVGWRLRDPFERAANRIDDALGRLVLVGDLCDAERRPQVQGGGPQRVYVPRRREWRSDRAATGAAVRQSPKIHRPEAATGRRSAGPAHRETGGPGTQRYRHGRARARSRWRSTD